MTLSRSSTVRRNPDLLHAVCETEVLTFLAQLAEEHIIDVVAA